MQFNTIKDYFASFGNLKNIQLIEEGWGWFIDIESNCNKLSFPCKNKFITHSYNHVFIPSTINENPTTSMRSFTSMANLHDETILFEKRDNLKINYNYNHQILVFVMHSVCILGVIGLIYSYRLF